MQKAFLQTSGGVRMKPICICMQDVLRYLYARPELLPRTPQPNNAAPERRQLSAGHARARTALPKKAFCDSQAGFTWFPSCHV